MYSAASVGEWPSTKCKRTSLTASHLPVFLNQHATPSVSGILFYCIGSWSVTVVVSIAYSRPERWLNASYWILAVVSFVDCLIQKATNFMATSMKAILEWKSSVQQPWSSFCYHKVRTIFWSNPHYQYCSKSSCSSESRHYIGKIWQLWSTSYGLSRSWLQ